MGFLLQCGAATLYHLGLRSTKAQHASILTYIDPFSAIVLAALFLHEPLTIYSVAGGLMIMVGGVAVFTCQEPSHYDGSLG